MRNKKRRLTSLMVAAVMCTQLIFPSIASAKESNNLSQNNPYQVQVIENNDLTRTTSTRDGNTIYEATYNKIDGTVQVSATDAKTGIKKTSPVVNIADSQDNDYIASSPKLNTANSSIAYASSKDYLNIRTRCNYEYTKWYYEPLEWQLRKPLEGFNNWEYFNTVQTYRNKDFLIEYEGIVDDIYDQEWVLVGTSSAKVLAAFLALLAGAATLGTGGAASPELISALATAAGATIADEIEYIKYTRLMEKAERVYEATYRYSR